VTRPGAPLLEESALLGQQLSDALCRTPVGDDHCGALHGLWGDLRLVGFAAEPDRHADFYAEALGACAATGASNRVLVSGCADWGMLATVGAAWRRSGEALDVTVVDRCPAPVLLCAWYGAQIGLPVRTAVADIAQYREERPFDLICTHSLLTYPPLEARRRLVANWRRLLRPGGAVVTVTRLSTERAARDDDKEHARRFAEALAQRCADAGLERDPIDLRTRAERYVRAQASHPVGDESDLRALFEQQGFALTRLDTRELAGVLPGRERVGGAARSGRYGEIVAVRP